MKQQRKGRLITYFLSFLPGAGLMYHGYMKRGFSYLTAFITSFALVGFLEFKVLYVIPILIWFYTFFDQINSLSVSREEQNEIEDKNFILEILRNERVHKILKNRHVLGGAFIFLGFEMIMRMTRTMILSLLPEFLQARLLPILHRAPQVVVGMLLLYAGVRLCQGNKTMVRLYERVMEAMEKKKDKEETIANANVVYYMKEGEHVLEQMQDLITPTNLLETSVSKEPEYAKIEKDE